MNGNEIITELPCEKTNKSCKWTVYYDLDDTYSHTYCWDCSRERDYSLEEYEEDLYV